MLVDSHCHLDFPDFEPERAEIIQRAFDAGVKTLVTISTRVRQFDRIREIAESDPNIWCSVGTHPHNADEELGIPASELIELAKHPKVIAIGEAGLDYFYDKAPREAQAIGFRNHIEASRATGLPLVIHARAADDNMIAILREEMQKGAFPFVLHCFSSGAELARVGVELGGYVSLSGIMTFKTSAAIRDIVKQVPLERLLVETDAPYLAPPPHRGKRNEPSYVVETAKVLADLRELTFGEMAKITTDNFFRLFSKAVRPDGAA